MALFYLLKEKLGMDFAYDVTSEGSIDPTTIYIHFKNNKINHCLERIATEEAMAEQLKQSLGDIDNETAKTQLLTDKFLLDLTKEEMCKNENLL